MNRAIRLLIGSAAAGAVGYGVWLAAHRSRWSDLLTNRIPAHHEYWKERGRADPESVLYVALGDSAALGLGASKPQRGYVGLLADEIGRITGKRVRVRNLAIDGATCAVVLSDELHRMPPETPLVCTIDVGANDVWTFQPERFRREFGAVLAALPAGSLVADVPSFSVVPIAGRVRRMNAIVREVVPEYGHVLVPLNDVTAVGGPFDAIRNAAGDLFHPNDRGHVRWAEAFLPALRARLAARGW